MIFIMARKILTYCCIAAFWLAVWQGVSMLVSQELLIPAPLSVAKTLCQNLLTASFWQAVGMSFMRIFTGFFGALVMGTLLAVVTTRFALVRSLLAPILHIIKAAPVASFIILALVWIPTGFLPAGICFLMVLPIVWNNMEQGIRAIDPHLMQMAQVFRFSKTKTLLRVQIPSLVPYFFTALTTGLGFAFKSGIAAEVICQPQFSVGKELYFSKVYLETPSVFMWTVVVIVISVVLERLLKTVLHAVGQRYALLEKGEVSA